MRPSDVAATVICVIFGGLTGWMLGSTFLAVLGVLGGAAVGILAARANVRPAITMTVFVGAMAGALVGASIVETICLPGSCVPLEMTAAGVSAIAAFIGVGLVAALVTRSFDEYNEHVAAGKEPPGPGCESEPSDLD
jgi:hypothetical protein